ncbi:hypothetical protein GPECTOR_1g363 [Gonium pectorale]|uniref:2-dehydropantoate 2-reductase n=1 Tax=Gonium pectorale TaxID=33097 RepID=A0A150H3K3_GONPE|nr:hypothetical protein GPECTOR_1g363 [Gonium pectorale]|eukprot:KXZ56408.1 hypothetical protein GPECTOR_1g363 [Gonium pectorale]
MAAPAGPAWHVLGAGSLGLLWAFHLRRAGFEVTLWMRDAEAVKRFVASGSRVHLQELWRGSPTPAWLPSEPILAAAAAHPPSPAPDSATVTSLGPSPIRSSLPFPHQPSCPQQHQQQPIHRLVVATKAPDTLAAVRSVLPLLAHGCRCILIQNGALAVVDQLRAHLGGELGLENPGSGGPSGPGEAAAASAVPRPVMASAADGMDTGRGAAAAGAAGVDGAVDSRGDEGRGRGGGPRVRLYVGSVTHGCYRGFPQAQEGAKPAAPSRATLGSPSAGAGGVAPAYSVVHAGLGSVAVGPLASLHDDASPARVKPVSVPDGGSAGAALPGEHDGRGHGHPASDQADGGARGADDDARFLSRLAASLPGLCLRPDLPPGGLLRELRAKLAVNCAINPLTALLGCRNGALAEQEHSRRLMRRVCVELVAVFGPDAFEAAAPAPAPAPVPAAGEAGQDMRQDGKGAGAQGAGDGIAVEERSREACHGAGPHAPEGPGGPPAFRGVGSAAAGAEERGGAADGQGPEPQRAASVAAAAALYERVLAVAVATGRNRSSMLQDVAAGRPTEADYLSGWLVREAGVRGVATPVNATLYELVKAREALAAGAGAD